MRRVTQHRLRLWGANFWQQWTRSFSIILSKICGAFQSSETDHKKKKELTGKQESSTCRVLPSKTSTDRRFYYSAEMNCGDKIINELIIFILHESVRKKYKQLTDWCQFSKVKKIKIKLFLCYIKEQDTSTALDADVTSTWTSSWTLDHKFLTPNKSSIKVPKTPSRPTVYQLDVLYDSENKKQRHLLSVKVTWTSQNIAIH